jgi:hypothetical protein
MLTIPDDDVDVRVKHVNKILKVLAAFGILSCSATAIGTAWMLVIVAYSKYMIYGMLYFSLASSIILGLSSFISGSVTGGIILALMAVATYFYIESVHDRIPFACAVLEISIKPIRKHYLSILFVASFTLAAALAWVATWTVAAGGIINLASKSETQSVWFWVKLFVGLVSLHWGCQLCNAVLVATVAGTLASWWYTPQVANPVSGTFLRVITASLGSLCFGSLIVSVIKAIHSLIKILRSSLRKESEERHRRLDEGSNVGECMESALLCLLNILVSWIEQAAMYFSKYAYCYVASYGYTFMEASSQVIALFKER